ncbi:unnamed protein product [Owenia fusiformis]|uniref:Uncharacterized protein n=1 Tax=Owenia fusiformis TaxID=6347 RepID=A0A8S4NHB0_OWEFU|nr:unnamed protein product [Owenia fusiformis]
MLQSHPPCHPQRVVYQQSGWDPNIQYVQPEGTPRGHNIATNRSYEPITRLNSYHVTTTTESNNQLNSHYIVRKVQPSREVNSHHMIRTGQPINGVYASHVMHTGGTPQFRGQPAPQYKLGPGMVISRRLITAPQGKIPKRYIITRLPEQQNPMDNQQESPYEMFNRSLEKTSKWLTEQNSLKNKYADVPKIIPDAPKLIRKDSLSAKL